MSPCVPAGLCLGYFRLVNLWARSPRWVPLSWLSDRAQGDGGNRREEFWWDHLLQKTIHRNEYTYSALNPNINTKLTPHCTQKDGQITSGARFPEASSHRTTTLYFVIYQAIKNLTVKRQTVNVRFHPDNCNTYIRIKHLREEKRDKDHVSFFLYNLLFNFYPLEK